MQLAVSRLQLGLFNPTTCERHVLPPLVECSSYSSWCGVDGYAIITAADGCASLDGSSSPPLPASGRFTFSQLLVITALVITTQPLRHQRYLHSYSAATRGWGGAPTPFLDGRQLYLVGEGPAAVHRGAAHWLMCNDDLKVNKRAPQDDCSLFKLSVELGGGGGGGTARMSLTELPVPVRPFVTPLLHVSRDGKLSVACMHPAHATVWTQQDDASWVRTQVFLIPMVATPNPTDPWPHEWHWHEFGRGSVLVLGRSGGVFVLDLEKEVMEKVMDCFPRLYAADKQIRKCVPYEMDLVEFFVSRLGGLLCRG
jgi:hypothetical protein